MSTLIAYANYGRWVVECPDCNSALAVKDFSRPAAYVRFGCIECGRGLTIAAWEAAQRLPMERRAAALPALAVDMRAQYAMPEQVDEIERILLRRPLAQNRNWVPGETLIDLERQNAVMGID